MKHLLSILLLLLFAGPARSQSLQLADSSEVYPVGYPMYLEDRHASFSFEKVAASKDFRVSRLEVPDFVGNLSKAIWYRFDVTNLSQLGNWYLTVKGGYMHQLTLFRRHSNGQVDSMSLFADESYRDRPVKSNDVLFPVYLPRSEREVFYLRATSKTLIRASMSFSSMQQLYERGITSSYVNGFLSALAVAMLLYNLFAWFSLKEKVYLYYIAYIATTIIHTNVVAGNFTIFLPWLKGINTTVLLPALGIFSVLFTNSFLQAREFARPIYRVRWLMVAVFALPTTAYIMKEYGLAITLVSGCMFLLFAYWLVAGIIAYRNAFQPAIYYLLGFGSLICMNLLFELKIVGWIRESYWIDSALYIGSALEAIILSFALASKITFYKKEKDALQQQAYEQAVNFSRELINMQEAERKRIASELHDSVGQKLSLVKNKVLRFTNAGNAGFQQNPEGIAESVADAIQEVRNISYGLRPYQIDLLGLTQSIRSLVSESFESAGIHYQSLVDDIDFIRDQETQINLYRIMQECINNIIKHARASNTSVMVVLEPGFIVFVITDDGIGFDPDTKSSGFGLKGLKERLQILAGSMTIRPRKPSGTDIRIILPYKTTSANGTGED